MKLYAFRDIKVGYMEPFLQQNDQIAIRTFTATIRQEKSLMTQYKEDIELWRIGEYDETHGDIIPQKEYLIGGKDVELYPKTKEVSL